MFNVLGAIAGYYISSIGLLFTLKCLHGNNVLVTTGLSLFLQTCICSLFTWDTPKIDHRNLNVIMSNGLYIGISNLAVNFSRGYIYAGFKSFTPFIVDLLTWNINLKNLLKTVFLGLFMFLSIANFENPGSMHYLGFIFPVLASAIGAMKLIFIKNRSESVSIDRVEYFPLKQLCILRDTSAFMGLISFVLAGVSAAFGTFPTMNLEILYGVPIISVLGITEGVCKFFMSELVDINTFSVAYLFRDTLYSVLYLLLLSQDDNIRWYNYLGIISVIVLMYIKTK